MRILGAPSTGQRGTEPRRGMPRRGRTGRKGVPEGGEPRKEWGDRGMSSSLRRTELGSPRRRYKECSCAENRGLLI